MKYREFEDWCNDRAHDGCWGMKEAIICIRCIEDIQSRPFWKRKERWREVEEDIVSIIVNPINEKISEVIK